MWPDWLVFCDYGFSLSVLWCLLATLTVLFGFLLPWMWGISLWLFQQNTATAPYVGLGVSPHGRPSWPWTWRSQYTSGDQQRNNSRKNEGMKPKQKQYPVVDVIGDRSKVRCCKEQYCIGTWNVSLWIKANWKVKKEMARVNDDILGISELKWTGMGKLNSDDHYIYYCGQESLRRNGADIMVNKRVWNAVLGCNVTNDRMISVRFQGKSFNITVIQGYAPTSNAEEAEVEWFYEDLQDLQN